LLLKKEGRESRTYPAKAIKKKRKSPPLQFSRRGKERDIQSEGKNRISRIGKKGAYIIKKAHSVLGEGVRLHLLEEEKRGAHDDGPPKKEEGELILSQLQKKSLTETLAGEKGRIF